MYLNQQENMRGCGYRLNLIIYWRFTRIFKRKSLELEKPLEKNDPNKTSIKKNTNKINSSRKRLTKSSF